jgi:hypothetical protein
MKNLYTQLSKICFINWNGKLYIENKFKNEGNAYFRPYYYGMTNDLINKLINYQDKGTNEIEKHKLDYARNKTMLFQIYYTLNEEYDLKQFDCLNKIVELKNKEILIFTQSEYSIIKDYNITEESIKINDEEIKYNKITCGDYEWKIMNIYDKLEKINNLTLNEIDEKYIQIINPN